MLRLNRRLIALVSAKALCRLRQEDLGHAGHAQRRGSEHPSVPGIWPSSGCIWSPTLGSASTDPVDHWGSGASRNLSLHLSVSQRRGQSEEGTEMGARPNIATRRRHDRLDARPGLVVVVALLVVAMLCAACTKHSVECREGFEDPGHQPEVWSGGGIFLGPSDRPHPTVAGAISRQPQDG